MTASTASQHRLGNGDFVAGQFGDDDFVAGQRAELHARRKAYREQAERLTAAVEELTQAQAGEAADLGDDDGFAEGDPLTVERDRVLTLAAGARRRIEEIDAALARLDAGAYGMCRTCHRPIPVARLEAVPEATQCVSCGSGSALRRR
jgi:RNA polymerase-binding transcription factor DksA